VWGTAYQRAPFETNAMRESTLNAPERIDAESTLHAQSFKAADSFECYEFGAIAFVAEHQGLNIDTDFRIVLLTDAQANLGRDFASMPVRNHILTTQRPFV